MDFNTTPPPILLNSPPPVISGFRPLPIPFSKKSRYFFRATYLLLPKSCNTESVSCQGFLCFPTITLWPVKAYLSSDFKSFTIPARIGFALLNRVPPGNLTGLKWI
ncbi:MAG: hypothetical protein DRH24_17515 [Deltaproteobacteria bacterium]|nr:MAG: hypothetical protein DRH24_17515 [Deltaproteobacteria bacterium]